MASDQERGFSRELTSEQSRPNVKAPVTRLVFDGIEPPATREIQQRLPTNDNSGETSLPSPPCSSDIERSRSVSPEVGREGMYIVFLRAAVADSSSTRTERRQRTLSRTG